MPRASRSAGTSYFYTRDHLGSVRELVDGSQTVRARYSYDPYGVRSANLITSNPVEADFGFTGHYYHAASGLHLAPYRAYNAAQGRWLNRDPIREEGGLNLYEYVANNPINAVDPFGLTDATTIVTGTSAAYATGNIGISWASAQGSFLLAIEAAPATAVGVSAAAGGAIGYGIGSIPSVRNAFDNLFTQYYFNKAYDSEWGDAREAYWKHRAATADEDDYSDSDFARMRQGLAPIDLETGAKKELHHIKPKCKGGSNDPSNLREVWPWEHDDIDPYRFYRLYWG